MCIHIQPFIEKHWQNEIGFDYYEKEALHLEKSNDIIGRCEWNLGRFAFANDKSHSQLTDLFVLISTPGVSDSIETDWHTPLLTLNTKSPFLLLFI